MKIGQINKPDVPLAGERQPAAPGKTAGKGEEASAQVELSATAKSLSGQAGMEFDAEKVERISQAIREGRFQINADVIADKLISNAQELLGRH